MTSRSIAMPSVVPCSGIMGRLQCKLARLAQSMRAYHAKRNAIAELAALDNRMLKDIGIDRSEISSVVLNGGQERRLTYLATGLAGSR
jgi:uncharacterized protein YjiS (DUF1127 family)